jgi:AcrR family transcriptional regulator
MRLLARELGCSPMAVYYYVASKDALVELVAETVLARIEVPPAGSGPWDERLRTLLCRSRAEVFAYPGLVPFLMSHASPPAGRQLSRDAWAIIRDGGFEPATVSLIFSAVQAYFLGHSFLQTSLERRPTGSQDRPSRRSGDQLPRLAEIADDAHFVAGLDALLRGLSAQRARPPRLEAPALSSVAERSGDTVGALRPRYVADEDVSHPSVHVEKASMHGDCEAKPWR